MAEHRTPPTGGGTGPRNRSRYAPDGQVTRAVELAEKLGMRLKLGADGSVEVLGRLDSPAGVASVGEGGESDADAEAELAAARAAIAGQAAPPARR